MSASNLRKFIFLAVFVLSLDSVTFAKPAAVTDSLPASAAWVVVADHIGQQSTVVRALLDGFKDLDPELGNDKIARELKSVTGEDLASPEGMMAYGIDPKGSGALWADDFDHEPYVLVPILDQKKFIERLSRQLKDKGEDKGLSKPKVRAGVKIYNKDGESFGIKNGYLVLEPNGAGHNGIKAFFSRGKKLGRDRSFVSVISGAPGDRDGLVYFSMGYIRKAWRLHQKDFQKSMRLLLKKSKNSPSRKMFSKELSGAQKTQKSFDRVLQDFRGIGAWWKVSRAELSFGVLFTTTPRGQKNMARIFPVPASKPGQHQSVIKVSLMGGWVSVRPGALLDWVGNFPTAPWITFHEEMERSARELKEDAAVDLFGDIIDNLRSPVSGYLLVPSLDGLDTRATLGAQIFSLIRTLAVSDVVDAEKAKALLSHFDELAQKDGVNLKHLNVQGVSVRELVETDKTVVSWAQSGKQIMIGFGQDPFGPFLKAPSSKVSDSADMIGEFRMDFPAFSELMSSAVSKGIGGNEGMRFRMMWPIVKQVLGRFGALDFKGFLRKHAVEISARLYMH